MFDTAFVLLVIAVLLVVVGLCQPLAAHLKLPPPVLLGVVGVALGVRRQAIDEEEYLQRTYSSEFHV